MADKASISKHTGYLIGAVSPLAQKHRWPSCVDVSSLNFACIFISGGRRGLEIEIAATDLCALCDASAQPLVSFGNASSKETAQR